MRAMISCSRKACELVGTRGRWGVLIRQPENGADAMGWGIENSLWSLANIPSLALPNESPESRPALLKSAIFPLFFPSLIFQACVLELM